MDRSYPATDSASRRITRFLAKFSARFPCTASICPESPPSVFARPSDAAEPRTPKALSEAGLEEDAVVFQI